MLSLVRSQQACMERIRSAVRWAGRLIVLVGAPGQGKSTVIEALVLRSPVNPLRLEGKLISDRPDVVLRLIGMIGLRPEGSDIQMLERLQLKQPAGIEHGIPEIIVDDVHCLPNPVLELFHELSSGAYGRRWSILLVGEDLLASRLQGLRPTPAIASTVLLPPWDKHDLEQAISELHPTVNKKSISAIVLKSYAMHPRQLIRAITEHHTSGINIETPQDIPDTYGQSGLIPRWIIIVGILLALVFTTFAFVQMNDAEHAAPRESSVPLNSN